jgi:hypothetical protein
MARKEYARSQLVISYFLEPHIGDTALSITTAVPGGGGGAVMFGNIFPFRQFLVISVNPVVIVAMFSCSLLRH